jgi:putative FmdB family regulatory protein
MPTYTRHCLKCDEIFDKMVRMNEKHATTVVCPYCDSTAGEWMITTCHTSTESSRFMTTKKDSGFNEVISKIQERNPRTAICER